MKNFLLLGRPIGAGTRNSILFLFRIFIGISMFTHGAVKLLNFQSLSATFADPIGLGANFSLVLIILTEVGCSLFLMFGLLTRLATIPLIFSMLVASFVVHAGDSFQAKELALFYLAAFVLYFFIGGGKYSLDYLFFGKRKKKR